MGRHGTSPWGDRHRGATRGHPPAVPRPRLRLLQRPMLPTTGRPFGGGGRLLVAEVDFDGGCRFLRAEVDLCGGGRLLRRRSTFGGRGRLLRRRSGVPGSKAKFGRGNVRSRSHRRGTLVPRLSGGTRGSRVGNIGLSAYSTSPRNGNPVNGNHHDKSLSSSQENRKSLTEPVGAPLGPKGPVWVDQWPRGRARVTVGFYNRSSDSRQPSLQAAYTSIELHRRRYVASLRCQRQRNDIAVSRHGRAGQSISFVQP